VPFGAASATAVDLMMLTGWKPRQMLQRYASSTAAERDRALSVG